MSLWSKDPNDITFEDVDEFCQTLQPEGARLDYKGIAFPSDLAKSLAAFANTLGGLLILGVEANTTTNTPIWPPQRGMPTAKALQERVYQIAREAVYPPVRVAVSPVLDNKLSSGNVVIVVRVDQSPEAPHAVEKNRKVLVYERDENQSTSYDLADIERIEHMLRRRDVIIGKREQALSGAIERALRRLEKSSSPIRWAAISPIFPWRDLCDRTSLRPFHEVSSILLFSGAQYSFQQIPGGSMAIGRRQFNQGDQRHLALAMSQVTATGFGFGMAYPEETLRNNSTLLSPIGLSEERPRDSIMSLPGTRTVANSVFKMMRDLYDQAPEKPSSLVASIGIRNAFTLRMYRERAGEVQYPDDDFRADAFVDTFDFLKNYEAVTDDLCNQLTFAFDIRS